MRTFRTVLEQKIKERRQSIEEFAEFTEVFARQHKELKLGTVSARHLQRLASGVGPKGRPLGEVRPATARLLEKIFDLSIEELLSPPRSEEPAVRVEVDVDRLGGAFDWLDARVGWLPESSQWEVTSRLASVDTDALHDRMVRRARVGRSQLARALGEYYDPADEYGLYGVRVEDRELVTSIVTRSEWVDLSTPLVPENERFDLVTTSAAGGDVDVRYAVNRLAEAAALDVRMTDLPIYRLLDVTVQSGEVSSTVTLSSFAEYALSMDLLEGEFVDSLAGQRGKLPLRDRYLPDMAAVLDLPRRLCAGGTLALCAIARPADPYRGPADFALLVQERSATVLNGARRLSVIPKAFHQPLKDSRADARISATLLREMEEELFGRAEVDGTVGGHRLAAPMHPSRLSEPMRWLMEVDGRLRMECTGFGLNLVSGNYEFAGLVVIDDEEFWTRFGGHVEANWEAVGLRVYSSLDADLVGELVADESWSNEGLFAFLLGLRRLSELGGERVRLPKLTATVR
ncbi:transcriptional regulator [Kibdelosporangium persicum]|uniref:Helix-turn-helix transcriptional regulator n=1 Tax=Kibdelosporangium persicum TaxID=2698649 RepID=A0ABX2FHT9_9PSEU|nr:transcriptional regulator [Kibdelosporangium persicum]NRN70837.1 Helix-turn-helix transcriptional regulator [Kibdelosporangium persicum]